MKDIHPSLVLLVKEGRYPTPDEAWGAYPKSDNETAFVCDEMTACGEPVMSMYRAGEELSARDVFVRLFRLELSMIEPDKKCQWRISLGDDPELRQRYLREALAEDMIDVNHFEVLGGHFDDAHPRLY